MRNYGPEVVKKHFGRHSGDKELSMTEHFKVNKPDQSAEHSGMHLTS